MVSWARFAREAPDIKRLADLLVQRQHISFLGTVRRDGSPRVHPVSPLISAGELVLVIVNRSPKAADLRRDPRCVLHALPGPADAEFWVEALAEPQSPDAATRWSEQDPRLIVPDGDTLFRLEIIAAHATIFGPGADGRPLPQRRHWSGDVRPTASALPLAARHV